MSEVSKVAGNALDQFIKYMAPLLGIATTALSLYIAVASRETNDKLASAKADLDKLTLASTQYDLGARVIPEFGAQNAREFSATFEQKKLPVDIPDAALRHQLVDGVGRWKGGNNLMTGAGATGLYLRQIVTLKLTSLGKTAATDLRLVVRMKDFDDKGPGTHGKRYGVLETSDSGWSEHALSLTPLMEQSPATQGMRTQILIPLAQVSGGEYYFGRILVPIKLLWKDERLGREQFLDLNVANESALDNQLHSAILGISTSSR
jgi:hypothetical protein